MNPHAAYFAFWSGTDSDGQKATCRKVRTGYKRIRVYGEYSGIIQVNTYKYVKITPESSTSEKILEGLKDGLGESGIASVANLVSAIIEDEIGVK